MGYLLRFLSLAAGASLLAIGLGFIFDHGWMADHFGVPLASVDDGVYLSVAGARDVFAGVLVFVFILLRDRRAIGTCILVGGIVPICDGLVALRHSPAPLLFASLHWSTAIGCLALGYILLRGRVSH